MSTVKTTLLLGALAICGAQTTAAFSDSIFQKALSQFGRKIFNEILTNDGPQNIILSPFAIQSCLTMLQMGADGQTAEQLQRGLNFANINREQLTSNYHSILAKYQQGDILKIANKIYVMQNEELRDDYNEILSQNFYTTAENIDFTQVENATAAINTWIASKTNNMIRDLITEDSISPYTRLYILSAIYFNGKWAKAFPKESTKEEYFYLDTKNFRKIQMMRVQSKFKFGFVDELEASAVILPYEDIDLSMLIILPNAIDGLANITRKLQNIELSSLIARKVKYAMEVDLQMPKFKAEFKIKLSDILKKVGLLLIRIIKLHTLDSSEKYRKFKFLPIRDMSILRMGMAKMFSSRNFGKMLKSPGPLALSEVIHQASIEINEEGTKAAAVAAADAYLRSSLPVFDFKVNRPFYYAIINEDFIPFFEGTFVGV
ncbi:serine protease inhibitor 3/4-like [Musca vetustissima]|uniref:serine protease inhibitor 3/4-like n=1 Tax=Musca vetustissima TaxID=27455 RepID=UPI002AB64271|nr:serine protease inhibitor 3/4-like [Musca vetustissima]